MASVCLPGVMKTGVPGQVPAVEAAVGQVLCVELLGAVLVVVLVRVEVVDDGGLVRPTLEGALIEGALAAAPRAHVALHRAFNSRVASKGGKGDEAGVLGAQRPKSETNIDVGAGSASLWVLPLPLLLRGPRCWI